MKSGMEITGVAPENVAKYCNWVFWGSFEHSGPLTKSSKRGWEHRYECLVVWQTAHDASWLHAERDVCKGSTDTPKMAIQQTTATIKLDYVGSAKTRLMATDETEKQQKQNPEPFRVGSMSENITIHAWPFTTHNVYNIYNFLQISKMLGMIFYYACFSTHDIISYEKFVMPVCHFLVPNMLFCIRYC